MKKYLFIGLMAVLATSCEKDPDLSRLDNNFTVYTNYDSKTNFNDFKTYCLPDSILLIGQGMKAEYWKDENAQEIIKQVADEMDTRGYTRVKVIKNANIGLQLSFTRQTTQIIGTGGWYGGGWYNGWWGPGYWGPYWNDWYYPYPVTYELLSSCLCLFCGLLLFLTFPLRLTLAQIFGFMLRCGHRFALCIINSSQRSHTGGTLSVVGSRCKRAGNLQIL